MPGFIKYHHIERFGRSETRDIEFGDCYVFPKLDGCFDYKTKILLADGSYAPIGTIVNQKRNAEVLSFDINTGQVVKNKITNWYKYESNKNEWLTITVCRTVGGLSRGGGRNRKVICTKNHNFIINPSSGEQKEASSLKVGDTLYVPQYLPTPVQKQVVLGTLLGDGSAYPNNVEKNLINGISFSHSTNYREYIDHKIKMLGGLYKSERRMKSGYGSDIVAINTVCNKVTQILYEIAYKQNKKKVTKTWLEALNSLGFSIWYMDDGSLSKNPNQRDRAIFHIDGFASGERRIIEEFFNTRGYQCHLQSNGKGSENLILTPEGTVNLFFDISPYIIDVFQYKISSEFQGRSIDLFRLWQQENPLGLVGRKIVDIKDGKNPSHYRQGNYKYDLEIENTHTYFADNVLVHNSNASIWLHEGELMAGSRRRELSTEMDNAGFYEWALKQDELKVLLIAHPDWHVYGEWLVPHTLKTYREDAWRRFWVFDVLLKGEKNRLLPYEEYAPVLEKYGLDYVQPICKIEEGSEEFLQGLLEKNTFLIEDGKGSGEGIVLKNYIWRNKFGHQIWAKLVRNEFKEDNLKAFGTPVVSGRRQIETEIADEFVTEAFVNKTRAKIELEEDQRAKIIPRLLQTAFYDIVNEEIWHIVKKKKNPTIDFKLLHHCVIYRVKKYAQDLF